jgi:hypothetical protein
MDIYRQDPYATKIATKISFLFAWNECSSEWSDELGCPVTALGRHVRYGLVRFLNERYYPQPIIGLRSQVSALLQ